ncbi:hypothetical protein [Winogradskyella sp. UBA3174]|uniref:hypothetical protein n=1 Tax=Winogradskyella sp. UBA3174 TaxID=1947785 RepID=UPI0025D05235|nr:hypothetical protein [Winogradskyella sp. UBA3174]
MTGAYKAIGKALALKLSKQNYKLVVSSRREQALLDVKNECSHPENREVLPFDLAEYFKIKGNLKTLMGLKLICFRFTE